MTTINAIKFDFYRGALINDEQTSMGDGFCSDISDKFHPCVPEEITNQYGTVASIGNTGSVAMGQALKTAFQDEITKLYRNHLLGTATPKNNFLNLEEMANLYFELVMKTGKQKLDEKLIGDFGFTREEFLHGSYNRNDQQLEIKDKELVDKLTGWLANRGEPSQMAMIFQNASLMAGFDEENGFQMFQFDQRFGYWHKVQTAYIAEGSGRHSVDPYMYDLMEKSTAAQRRGQIDPTEGLFELINAVNACEDHEAGIGGYFNITLVDGTLPRGKERMREIADHRAKLASHLVRATSKTLLEKETAFRLLNELLFQDGEFNQVYQQLLERSTNPQQLRRLMRGYKIRL